MQGAGGVSGEFAQERGDVISRLFVFGWGADVMQRMPVWTTQHLNAIRIEANRR